MTDTQPELIAERYRVQGTLGRGGMGSVYHVLDESTGQHLALKLLAQGTSARTHALFKLEYRTLASIRHPSIVRVYSFGVSAEQPFYTMEMLDGLDMRELAPLPYREVARHLVDVASALALLHVRGLVHRDISPRNVRATSATAIKLLDFGALAPFGAAPEIVGTPPYLAPEALERGALDARTDLYSLGATAYWMLTGRDAFPARSIRELPEYWAKGAPPRPSEWIAGIPSALDEGVMSLLHPEPAKRLSSAADVIEHLRSVAELPRGSELDVAESYLSSPSLVGRIPELTAFARLLDAAVQRGRASCLLIRGESGLGKTRLLDELLPLSELGYAGVVRLAPPLAGGALGAVRTLAERLFQLYPESATRAALPWAPVLRHLPELDPWLTSIAPAVLSDIPGERSARITAAVEGCVLALSAERTLTVLVDDADKLDPALSAFLLALVRKEGAHKLLVVVAETSSDRPSQASSDGTVHELELMPLDQDDVSALVAQLFGEADSAIQLAKWLSARSLGNPLHIFTLLRELCARSALRYAEGTWVLPEELPSAAVDSDLRSALLTRFQTLSIGARRMAELLSVAQRALDEVACAELDELPPVATTRALDELTRRGIVRSEGRDYLFVHETLRAVVHEQLAPERRSELHRAIAKHIAQDRARDAWTSFDAAFHFLHGGDETRAVDLVLGALDLPLPPELLQAHTGLFERVYECCVRTGRTPRERFATVQLLAAGAYYADATLAERYAADFLLLGEQVTGIALARKLTPMLGPKLAMIVGLLAAAIAAALDTRARVKLSLSKLLGFYVSSLTSLVAAYCSAFDLSSARRTLEALVPLSVVGPAPSLSLEYCRFMVNATAGKYEGALGQATRMLERLERGLPGLDDTGHNLYKAGIYYIVGGMEAAWDSGRATVWLDRLEKLDIAIFRVLGEEQRSLYHMRRGEPAEAQACKQRADALAARVPSSWQRQVTRTLSSSAFMFELADVISIKRVHAQLEELGAKLPGFKRAAKSTEGLVCLLRLDARGAIDALVHLYEQTEPFDAPFWAAQMGWLTRAYNLASEHERAKEVAEYTLRQLGPEERDLASSFGVLRELSIAEAELGDTARAAQRLDEMIEMHASARGPLALGSLHETRARIALCARDAQAFRTHLAHVQSLLEPLGIPGLLLQVQQLAARGRALGLLPHTGERVARESEARNFDDEADRRLARANSPAQRVAALLAWVSEETRASSAFVFRWDPPRLVLLGGSADRAPAEHVALQLQRELLAHSAQGTALSSRDPWEPTTVLREDDRGDTYTAPLWTSTDGIPRLFGALVLEQGETLLKVVHPGLLRIVCERLQESERVTCTLASG